MKYFEILGLVFNGYLAALLILVMLGLSPQSTNSDDFGDKVTVGIRSFLTILVFGIPIIFIVGLVLWLRFDASIKQYIDIFYELNIGKLMIAIGMSILILAIKYLFLRRITVYWSKLKRKFSFVQSNVQLSDVSDEYKNTRQKDFNPEKYYDKSKGYFIGLDDNDKPIYIPIEEFHGKHAAIIGPTQSGKGVVLGCIIDQSILFGNCTIVVAPKLEKYTARIMKRRADEKGKKFIILDLVEGKNGSYSPFRGGKLKDIINRTREVFMVRQIGSDADYHKGGEMRDLDYALQMTDRGTEDIYQFLRRNRSEHEKPSGIENSMYQLTGMHQIITKLGSKPKSSPMQKIMYPATKDHRHPGGLSVARNLLDGNVIYVRSKTNDKDVIDVTKLFLMEVLQEAERLDPHRKSHLSTFFDEYKFLSSETVTDSLAMMAEFRTNIVLLYQDKDDPKSIKDKAIDKEANLASTTQNTQIKLIYGTNNVETAKWASEQAGTINKTVASFEKAQKTSTGAEKWQPDTIYKQESEEMIPVNKILVMPQRAGILIRQGELAKCVYTSWVNVDHMPTYHEILSEQKRATNQKNKEIKKEREGV